PDDGADHAHGAAVGGLEDVRRERLERLLLPLRLQVPNGPLGQPAVLPEVRPVQRFAMRALDAGRELEGDAPGEDGLTTDLRERRDPAEDRVLVDVIAVERVPKD